MARKLAKQLFHHGDRWGRVQVVGVSVVRYEKKNIRGYKEILAYRLRCECGRVFSRTQTVLEDKGQKGNVDCGCGAAQWDSGKVPVCLSIPVKVFRRIHREAEKEGIPITRAVMEQIEVPGMGFDWRVWNGEENLPRYCYRRSWVDDIPMVRNYNLPSKMAAFLRRAAKLYGQEVSRIYMGILAWKWERDMGREDHWQLVRDDEDHPESGEAMYLQGADEV